MLVCEIKDFNEIIEQSGTRSLTSLSVEFTNKCNFGCEHCFLANPLEGHRGGTELSYDEWLRIFDQYVEQGGLFITVTGGEPLLRKDFKNLWIALKQRGLLISLFTNGSLIDRDMVDFLSQWSPYEVSISLYGATEETYRAVTGKKNMFATVMESLNMLQGAGIPLEVKSVFNALNVHEFSDVKKIGESYCELFRWDVDLIGSFSYSGNRPQDLRLTPKQCAELEAADPIRNQELKNRFEDWQPPENKEPRRPFGCGIGYNSAYVDSRGGMHPCLPLERVSYDLKNGTLQDGWHRAIPELLRTFPHEDGPCLTCEAFELCGQCVAFALLDGCSATGLVPFKCELARERARIYGFDDKLTIKDSIAEDNSA